MGNRFKINTDESFEHLPNAPIVEAVIHWQAVPGKAMGDPNELLANIKQRLPSYAKVHPQQQIVGSAEFRPEGSSVQQTQSWHGFRFEDEAAHRIGQFTRDGLIISQLSPYTNWISFEAEALRLWEVYCELLSPSNIHRLGVRFINQIALVSPDERLDTVLAKVPSSLQGLGLPRKGFMHQTLYEIPDHPYNLNVIYTIHHSPVVARGLILDFDVFTTRMIQCDEVRARFAEMRWIKNKAFFSSVTEDAITQFRVDG